jgi:tRNA_anti-like
MWKKILGILVVVGIVGGGVAYYMWNKPHPKAENATAIVFKADDLFKEYGKDEKAADAKYLNKVIEVTGAVGSTETNQDGGVMVILNTSDPSSGIQCSMREKNVAIEKGKEVTIRGFCTGNGITGVSLTDCVIKK